MEDEISDNKECEDKISYLIKQNKILHDSEIKYKSIFNYANDAIFFMSNEEFIDCNPKTLELYDCTREQIIGQPPYKFSPEYQPDGSLSKDKAISYIKKALSGDPQLFEWVHCKYDRSTFYAEVSLNRLEIGEDVYLLAIVRDITAKKKALELQIEAEAAKAASKAKGDFLANMSHEIRTPMNAILGLAHLALQTNLTAIQYDYLRKIEISGKSLLGIINDILDFSKIEAGKLKIEHIDFDLEEVMTNVSTVISVKAVEKPEIEVLFDIEPIMPCRLIGDPLRLGQILINLCNNALKFTEKGEVIVRARLLEDKGEFAVLEFAVEDTGIGLTEKQQAKLFQSFNQADSSITRKYGGTGLGLSISKKLVELMNGEIKVESKIDEGSTFSFYVVLGKQDRPHIERNLPLNMSGTKTLVVDDCEVSRIIIKRTLESFSFNVTCASSGREALDLLENEPEDNPFELVLMDWKMPHMDGLEAVRLMKERNKNPKFILVTAYDREEILEKSEKIGLDGHITKPFTGSILFDTIIESFATGGTSKNISIYRGKNKSDDDDIKGIIGAKVLVVEDNEINQQIAVELLQQMFLDVVVANDGREAVDKANKNDFDIILMDIQMPKMSGLEATKHIRSSYKDQQKKIPIVAMTAHAMSGDAEKSFTVGMNDHITKPIDPVKLRKTLIKWIPHGVRKVPELYRKRKTKDNLGNRPNSFPGISIAKGLKNVNNNKDLYFSLLKKFYFDNLSTSENIENALFKNDDALSARLAHTCKGVSGSIGALEVFRLSGLLENAILNKDENQVKDMLDLFKAKLKSVLNGLADFANEKELIVSQKNGNKELFDDMLMQLKDATKIRKVSASKKIVKELKSYIWTDDYAKDIIRICEAVDKYDFKKAHDFILEILGDSK